MIQWFRGRYLELLGSIYVYNEHRGYTAIDRVIDAVRARAPVDRAFLAAVEKHRRDERKHYEMFRRWFDLRGTMPFEVGRACGHIDRFVEIVFGLTIDDLDNRELVARDDLFDRLCRVIALTERRGHRQVLTLLRHPIVRRDATLVRIFRIVERDEPSHWTPYESRLDVRGVRRSTWLERRVDAVIHLELLMIKLPLLFLSAGLRRRAEWPDHRDVRHVPAPDGAVASPA